MSNKNELNQEQLHKVTGGEITNGSEHLSEKEQLEKQIASLQEALRLGNYKDYQECLEMMDRIVELQRQLLDLENSISKNE